MKGDNNQLHLGIILDGNRRYSKKAGIPKLKGHEIGYYKIKDVLQWCVELRVNEVTMYCLSTENFNRSKEEIDYLFNLFRKRIEDFKKDKIIHDNKIRISFVGRLSMFPEDMQKAMKEVMDATKDYQNYKLNLAMAYGSRSELVDAFNCIIKKGIKEVDEKTIQENLYVPDDVDIMVRPGGEKRLSNFLLWQNSYSEFYFLDALWPEFQKDDLMGIIQDFKQRERRFGK